MSPQNPILKRMCSWCREAIRDDSLALNKKFFHVACVEYALDSESLRHADDGMLCAEFERRGIKASAKPELFTDDQLRAECERRNLISGDLAVVDLVRASDGALLAECRRRGSLNVMTFAEVQRREEGLKAERDEWKRRAMRVAVEHGEGIAKTAAMSAGHPLGGDGHYIDPLDLLCEDA